MQSSMGAIDPVEMHNDVPSFRRAASQTGFSGFSATFSEYGIEHR